MMRASCIISGSTITYPSLWTITGAVIAGRHQRRSLRIPNNAAFGECTVLGAIEIRSLLCQFSLSFLTERR